MSIFGQVWLWSVAAFVIGVLLTWLLLVRPAQARNRVLERRLLAAQSPATPERAPARPTGTLDPGPAQPTRTLDREPEAPPTPRFQSEPDNTPFAAVAPEPAAPEPDWYERDSFGDRTERAETSLFASSGGLDYRPSTPDSYEPSTENSYAPSVENSYEPSTEDSYEQPAADEYEQPSVRNTLEPEDAAERTSIFAAYDRPEPERGSLFDPASPAEPTSYESFSDESAAHGSLTGADLSTEDEEPSPVEPETAIEATQILPKRQPRSTPRGGFEPPQPIQPSMRSIERREPVADEGGRSGSLFEPVVRPNSAAHAAPEPAPTPPPARKTGSESAVPSGPFGPGSAMPRPGGGRPADDFAVKASVTALRYCTEDSPQFSQMVAEVWFRTAADAERVGFRPLD
ncbi:MAG TPA: hypothetical protein VHC43_18055 [Mycobacteriales bacterium]|nr:hypothetical protein [Mycobacteriales bacterium]